MRALACAVLSLTLAACTQPTTPAPSPAPSPSVTVPGSAQTLAVYYTLTEANKGPRLVREFHKVAVPDGLVAQVRAAANEMLSRNAIDPDYISLWPPAARVTSVTISGNVATLDLSGAATANLGAEASAIALQQLVWTATAVPGIDAVKLMLDGKPATELWGHLNISQPQRREPAVNVLYRVWLIDPQHGDRVGKQFTMHIAGIAFEATVNYEIRLGTTVVKEGFVTLSAGPPQQGEAKQSITLEPGEYVIAAFLISAEDGSRQSIDNHTVVVA